MHKRAALVMVVGISLVAAFTAGSAWGANPFVDVAGNTHEANIDAIYNAGITSGCDATHYCPADFVTRAQMGTFLARLGGFGKNLPKANAHSDRQTYCAMAKANPGAFPLGPCTQAGGGMSLGYDFDFAIGSDGFPILSSQHLSGFLAALHCTEGACSPDTGPIETLDNSTPDTGAYNSIAVGRDSIPIISYYDAQNHDLRVAVCNGYDCDSTDAVNTLDSTGDVGRDTSIAIGADGRAVISYYDKTNGHLKLAHCNNDACSTSILAIVDDGSSRGTTDDVGAQTSIAIGTDGFPIISYLDKTDSSLRVAHCTTVLCTGTVNTRTVGAMDLDGQTTSITIGVDGMPIVAYKSTDKLLVAHCTNVACSTAPTITTVDGGVGQPEVGASPSIAIGSDGKPMLAYKDVTNNKVVYAHCTSSDCSGTASVHDFGLSVEPVSWVAVKLGMDGVPLIGWSINGFTQITRITPGQ